MTQELTPLGQIQAVSKGYGVGLGDICISGDEVKMSFQDMGKASSFVQILAESIQPQVRIYGMGDDFFSPVEIGFPYSDDPFGHADLIRKANAL